MSLLLKNGLPFEIDGVPIYPDFRNMMAVEMVLRDEELGQLEKTSVALDMLYAEAPKDLQKAIEGFAWFFACGQPEKEQEDSEGGQNGGPAYDFEQDAGLIYAAFYAAYGMSLTTIEFLHWWEFCALFAALPDDALIRRVMYWRTVPMHEVAKHEKEFVGKMKKAYALSKADAGRKSLAEVERQTADWAKRRFEAAENKLLRGSAKFSNEG